MARSRTLLIPLSILGLFLLGTVVVLSSISYYLAIEPTSWLTDVEVPPSLGHTTSNDSRALERIPRIIHQTWKTDVLPDRWKAVSKTCTSLMPDYEYMLWTDESSREFIAKEYNWFLDTFDGYPYPIQRADAIRYFVLHHYGGVYLDLDVGCMRPLDPLLVYPVILPKTIPVGVSNDLMFSAKGHPFMEQTIHNLITFDHNYFLNYPTVMFSTGPMYVSAQYGLYTTAHPDRTAAEDVRVLAKSLYGKNASPEEAPNTFFSHHYGSSWHADDAAFITFLGKWGRLLMRVGAVVLLFGVARMFWSRRRGSRGSSIRRRFAFGRVDLLLPRGLVDSTYRHKHSRSEAHAGGVPISTLLYGGNASEDGTTAPSSANSTPSSSQPSSPTLELQEQLSLLPLPFDIRSSSASPSRSGSPPLPESGSWAGAIKRVVVSPFSYFSRSSPSKCRERCDSTMAHAVGRASACPESSEMRMSPSAGRRVRRTGIRASLGSQSFIGFLPAIFTPASSSSSRTRSSSGSKRSDKEKAMQFAAETAAEAKAREAGFTLPFPTTSNVATNGLGGEGLLGPPRNHAESSSAASSGAATPTGFYTPRTSLSSSALGLGLAPDGTPLPASALPARDLHNSSPLLIDSHEGSDVRTTSRMTSNAPPPYRAASSRMLTLTAAALVNNHFEGDSGLMTP